MSKFGDRLDEAISLAESSRAAVATAVGITAQGVGQVIRGDSNAFTAENCARAAALLQVNYHWLATGEGKPRPMREWPFESFLPSQYSLVDEAIRRRIESELLGEVVRLEGSAPPKPFVHKKKNTVPPLVHVTPAAKKRAAKK